MQAIPIDFAFTRTSTRKNKNILMQHVNKLKCECKKDNMQAIPIDFAFTRM